MKNSSPRHLVVEIAPHEVRIRIWQILPGFLSWGTLLALSVLSFFLPYWIAIFIIAYDIYVLIRVVYMSIHLLYAYAMLHRHAGINWLARCQGVSGDINQYLQSVRQEAAIATEPKQKWQLQKHIRHLETIIAGGRPPADWQRVHHIVVLPTYNESYIVLKASVEAVAKSDFPKERMHMVVGFEERAGDEAKEKALRLTQEFSSHFKTFLTTFHPANLPGEKPVKSANATWAVQRLEEILKGQGVAAGQILVSNFDSDTVVQPEYFSYLTYVFITHPNKYRVSYQPLPVYNNNVWDAPAFSRVIATGSTFWQMIESTRPALKDVGYWQKDIISEDSRIFWQCLLHYDGNYATEPLYTTVSMDAALAPGWWQTLKNQYVQKRRWAWGIENFPYLAEGFLRNKKIPKRTKWSYLFRTLEGHLSWSTSAIIAAGLGWLPLLLGGPEFHSTVLSYSLPRMTRTLMSIAMGGLIISATLSLLLLPPRPKEQSRLKYVFLILQWMLVPVIATLLSAFPALDAETRLMLGRDLHFNVMQKGRKQGKAVIS